MVIDREVVYSGMTDWRRFGRAPDFPAKIKDVISQRRDRRKCVKGSCMGLFAIGERREREQRPAVQSTL